MWMVTWKWPSGRARRKPFPNAEVLDAVETLKRGGATDVKAVPFR